MRTIWKFPIHITDRQFIDAPVHMILHVGLDPQGVPCIWAIVDPDAGNERVRLVIVGTGHPLPATAIHHLGSFNQGQFVWHVFRETV